MICNLISNGAITQKSVCVFVAMWSKCGKIVTVNESDWWVCQYDCTTLSTFICLKLFKIKIEKSIEKNHGWKFTWFKLEIFDI